MNPDTAREAAALLWRHRCAGTVLHELPLALRPNTHAEGHAIQAELSGVAGRSVVGWKVAATSQAGQAHINVGGPLAGRILAGGVRDMADWVNKLYGQAFAAVYVQPGARVAVHLEQPLDIDYDAKGRRVHHRTGEAHASDLD